METVWPLLRSVFTACECSKLTKLTPFTCKITESENIINTKPDNTDSSVTMLLTKIDQSTGMLALTGFQQISSDG